MDEQCARCLSEEGIPEKEASILISYIPHRVVRRIEESACCLFENPAERLSGVIVYFDLVGFTPLVFNYIKSGRGPIEQLSKIFFAYYGLIIEPVHQLGGSLYQFAGDSLLMAFDRQSDESEKSNWDRAWTAIRIMVSSSAAYDREHRDENGFSLIPKIGVGTGSYHEITIGDRNRFVTPIIAGKAVNEAIACEKACPPRAIVLGASAYAHAENSDTVFTQTADGTFQTYPDETWAFIDSREEYYPLNEIHNRRFYKRALTYIAPQIRGQITANYSRFSGEYREVTCVMVRIEGDFIDTFEGDELSARGVENLSAIYRQLQEDVQRYGGFMLKPDVSDKGNVFPILFGTPLALENKEKMAILFADSLLNRGRTTPCIHAVSAGIATGKLYCGELGTRVRRDYSVVGVTVNLAARLMMCGRSGIYVDETTYAAVNSFCTAEAETGIPLKGFDRAQSVYHILTCESEQKNTEKQNLFVGRTAELAIVMKEYEKARTGETRVTGIVGDAGMGKSLLVDEFLRNITYRNESLCVLRGFCYQYEQGTTFFPWRKILYSLFSIEENQPAAALEKAVRSKLAEYFDEKEQDWVVPLLILMGFQLAEPAATANIDAEIKQATLFSLIRRMLLKTAANTPLVLVIDDIHWIDDVSMRLIEFIGHSIEGSPIYIILLTREESNLSYFSDKDRYFILLRLSRLDEQSARELIELLLKLDHTEELLTEKLMRASDCNPFFIENIVLNLITQGDVRESKEGKRYLAKDIEQITIPSSIQSIILSRLDNLQFEEQVIIKTASVIGRTFLPDVLKAIIPDSIEKNQFIDALEDFEDNNLILREDGKSVSYIFKHITVRDVIYNTLLERTRKELNKALLVYMEQNFAGDITAGCERLAYHSLEAGEYERALRYSLMAAHKAERQFANVSAVNHYGTALSMLRLLNPPDIKERMDDINLSIAAVYRRRGEYDKSLALYRAVLADTKSTLTKASAIQGTAHCYQEQGQFMLAIDSVEKSLAMLGKKPPKGTLQTYLFIAAEALTEIASYLFCGNLPPQAKGDKRKIMEKRAENLQVLSKLYYFGKVEQLGWATISNFNNSARIQYSPDAYCRSCADYGVTLVSAGLKQIGLHHFALGQPIADKTANQTTKSIFNARYAYYFLFHNQPERSIQYLEEAVVHFRDAGEMWELMTATGALAQNYFLVGNLEKSEKTYLETERVAVQLNSPMHIGWSYNKVPFIRYLRGEISRAEAQSALKKGIEFSRTTHDHMTLCIHYGHLCYIAEKERLSAEAYEYAREVLKENRLYTVNIPHVKISLVNAAEALLSVLESGNRPVPEKQLVITVRYLLVRALRLGREFSLIEGPAWRARARFALYRGHKAKADTYCIKALELLEKTPYRWEYANALLLASVCLPQKRQKYRVQASEVLAECGMMGEINRIPMLYSDN